jgi:glycerophosphoryl diester phosphodiesterase
VALGADMIEFDVRRTKDHVLIVYHDEWIQGYSIKDLTYGAISQISGKQGFDISTVEEVLKWSRGKIKLDIELKDEGYEEEIVELLIKYFEEDRFVITSFNDASLGTVKERNPDIKTGLILGKEISPYHLLTQLQELFPTKRCQRVKADILVAHWKLLRFGFLERAKRNHQPVFVWTVNDEQMMRKLLQDGRVYAIITDKPDLAVSLRKK